VDGIKTTYGFDDYIFAELNRSYGAVSGDTDMKFYKGIREASQWKEVLAMVFETKHPTKRYLDLTTDRQVQRSINENNDRLTPTPYFLLWTYNYKQGWHYVHGHELDQKRSLESIRSLVTHTEYYIVPVNDAAKAIIPEERWLTEQTLSDLITSVCGTTRKTMHSDGKAFCTGLYRERVAPFVKK
jgi:hypothetical protein